MSTFSTEECARRLGVTDQTIRNWILAGRHEPDKGWTQGIHYVVINPLKKKQIIRIPWNHLVLSYAKGDKPTLRSFDKGMELYQDHRSPENCLMYLIQPSLASIWKTKRQKKIHDKKIAFSNFSISGVTLD
jgi:hypothetical protein